MELEQEREREQELEQEREPNMRFHRETLESVLAEVRERMVTCDHERVHGSGGNRSLALAWVERRFALAGCAEWLEARIAETQGAGDDSDAISVPFPFMADILDKNRPGWREEE